VASSKGDRNLYLRGGMWYVDFCFGGKRIRQVGGFTKEQARNTLAKLRIEMLDEKLGFKKPASEDIPFATFADELLETYCKQNKKSWRNDEQHLEKFKKFFKGDTLRSIGPEKVERYKAERKAEVTPSTVNRGLACLKTLFNKAVEWGRLDVSPVRNVKKFKEPKGRERILSPEEIRRLIANACDWLRPIIIVALNTGMRRNEILSLRWRNIDLVKLYISIEDSKSGKPRTIPINMAVYEALLALPHESEFVFYNSKSNNHYVDTKTAFHATCKNAKSDTKDENDKGIVGVRFHDLRHTAATKMIEAGVDLVTVSKILGHASIQMTMRYAHPTPENIRKAVERLGEMINPKPQNVEAVAIPQSEHHPVNYN
jgi:integrase